MAKHHRVSIGIDLGGTSIRVAVCDSSMRLLDSCSMTTRVAAGPQSAVEDMAAVVRQLLEDGIKRGCHYDVVGVGIGSPGPINLRTGVLGSLPNFPGWDNFPLRDALTEALGLPVTLESDANAAAIAEWKLGAGKATGLESMIMITLGTGVGSGIILNGKIWHGMFGMGGEIGHATIDPDGLLCGCGSRGCLEMYSSANALLRLTLAIADSNDGTPALRKLADSPEMLSPLLVAQLAEKGDSGAKLAFHQLGRYLGIGVSNVINTLDVPMIVIGGGVASAWALFAKSMFQAMRDYSVVYRLVKPIQLEEQEHNCTFVCPAALGPSAGLLGASLLPYLNQSLELDTVEVQEIAQ